jgi:tetratricopeptide (TPR) repeat protein
MGEVESARAHIEILKKRFPESSRVEKLEGLALEAEGKFDKALELYDGMLKKNHANLAVMKRMVACRKAKREKTEAVKDLLSITTNFPGDLETWLELADLYIEFRNYAQAAFCLEEVILIDPTRSHYHNKLADIYYTLGTPSDASTHQADAKKHLLLARKHYSVSLTMQNASINRKAVYGVKYASLALEPILKAVKGDEMEAEVNKKMLEFAEEQIKEGKLSLK